VPERRCLPDLADECTVNNGGCWKGDYTVKGSKQTFSACKDELESYRVRWRMPLQGVVSGHLGPEVSLTINCACSAGLITKAAVYRPVHATSWQRQRPDPYWLCCMR